jgi:hypothetical protein
MYAVSCGAGRRLVRTRKDQRFGAAARYWPHAGQYWPSQTVQAALRPSACNS